MDFRNAYAQGFARVAACTVPVALADPATNAERVIVTRQGVPRRGGRGRPLPRAVAERLRHRRPADAGRPARGGRRRRRHHRRGHRQAAPPRRRGRPAAARQPALQLRGRHPPRRGARRRPQVVPAQLPRVLREAALRLGRRPPGRVHRAAALARRRRRRRDPVRPRPDLQPRGPARPRGARRDLRGHVGAGTAEPRGGARRRHRAAQPLGLPDHRRPRRGPPPARPLGQRPLQRRLPLRRRDRR